MLGAEWDEVGEVAGTTVAPVEDVVWFAVVEGDGAAVDRAPWVHRSQRVSLGGGCQAAASADVDSYAVAVEHDWDDVG